MICLVLSDVVGDDLETIASGPGVADEGTFGNCLEIIETRGIKNRLPESVIITLQRAMMAFSQIKEAMVFAFPPPPVIELGMATGFDFQLQDRGGLGHEALTKARNQLLGMAMRDPRLVRVRPNGMEDVPEYHIDVDWEKAGVMGVPVTSINSTISAAFGSAYVNDFIQAGRVKRVYIHE